MAAGNQDVLDMIAQLRARLADLEADVRAFDGDLSSMVAKLDRLDDKVYLLDADLEKQMRENPALRKQAAEEADAGELADGDPAAGEDSAGQPAEGEGGSAPASEEGTSTDSEGDNGMNILTPEAKAKIGEFTGDMRVIGREAAETFSSLNEAFSDITAPFKSFTKPGRRR